MAEAIRHLRFWLVAGLMAGLAWAHAEAAERLLSYEAIPSAQVELPKLDAATYAQRAEVTARVLRELVPAIIQAVGVEGVSMRSELTPGGYLLKTNASLQSKADLDAATADKLAAALGYVFRQWSVLVTVLGIDDGQTGYVVVRFPDGTLNADRAQGFFTHAAGIEKGLGGGYTAFGDDQIFLNLRGEDGAPYSEIEDDAFVAGLKQAVASFEGGTARVVATGLTEAHLVENDWESAPDGGDYVRFLDGAGSPLLQRLDALRAQHTSLILEEAARLGWK